MNYCSSCGNPVVGPGIYCQHCGSQVRFPSTSCAPRYMARPAQVRFGLRDQRGSILLALSALFMLIGTIAPWATGPWGITANLFSGGALGPVFALFFIVAATGCATWSWLASTKRTAFIVGLVTASISVGLAILLLVGIIGTIQEGYTGYGSAPVSIGAGAFVVLIGAALALLGGIIGIKDNPRVLGYQMPYGAGTQRA
jgi:hypothetical protein